MWLLVGADHAAVNATIADRTAVASGHSTVPAFLHAVWSWTGHGFNRGLLLGLLAAATVADARAQTGEFPSRATLRIVSRSWRAASRSFRANPGPLPARAANALAALAVERRHLELSAPPFSPTRPWLATRTVAGPAATLGVALSVLMARRSRWASDRRSVPRSARSFGGQAALARLRQQVPPEDGTFEDVEAALSRLPVIAEDLVSKPQPVLRQLFDVEVTLWRDEGASENHG